MLNIELFKSTSMFCCVAKAMKVQCIAIARKSGIKATCNPTSFILFIILIPIHIQLFTALLPANNKTTLITPSSKHKKQQQLQP